ncbi:MAG: 5'-nucleotidase C-terminal domain-containing protein [Erysipelotrichaceae bacterium]|nr:5'-nucleotidase C-terminal domain-containing protein [Erysipelotrichaceae bacterium]
MSIVKLDILNHADYGGEFREHDIAPGLSRFYSAIESVRSLNREHTLLLDAGDNINRVLWHGKEVFEGLALIGTDAYTLGNHEFDRGKEELEEAIDYVKDRFPILCSNILLKDTQELIQGVQPYVILDKGGIKIGIVGCTTEYTPYMVEQEAFKDFVAISSVEALRAYIPKMREEGAEVIVVLTHFPFYFTEDSESGELLDVFEAIEDLKPDAMIGGHIPGDYARVVRNCAITKGGFGGKSLPHIELYFDTETRKVVDRKCRMIDVWHGNFEKNPRIDAFVERVTGPYDYYFEEVLGEAIEDIPMRLSKESPMGDLLSDAVREMMNVDFAYFNCTSCGWSIPKGDITRFVISKAMGFNDPLQVSEYTGQDIWNLFTLVYEPERFGNNGNLMFSGLKVEIDNTKPYPNKVVSIQELDGKNLDLKKKYRVVTSKYMASGGNDTRIISSRVQWLNTEIPIHDILAAYVMKHKKLSCPQLGRYPMIGEIENDNSPW